MAEYEGFLHYLCNRYPKNVEVFFTAQTYCIRFKQRRGLDELPWDVVCACHMVACKVVSQNYDQPPRGSFHQFYSSCLGYPLSREWLLHREADVAHALHYNFRPTATFDGRIEPYDPGSGRSPEWDDGLVRKMKKMVLKKKKK